MQKIMRFFRGICVAPVIFMYSMDIVAEKSEVNSPTNKASENLKLSPELEYLRLQIAQKLFIDLRYYCEEKQDGYCQQALTTLPKKLKHMLAKTQVGGVILFAENLQNTAQILRLNKSLQQSLLSSQGLPLYIGIDQEGGRVSRLPQHQYLGFAGNMAIGATLSDTQHSHTYFAEKTGTAIANQLNYLGFNVNFAPVLDVNSNPDNPIINVRSYGQSADNVSLAGGATIRAMQNNGIATAAKHFPGHGDTHVDSHVGLPVVNHTLEEIHQVDLAPFKQVIASAKSQPDMIMSAHIQYPALDNTAFVSKSGEKTILPATLSEKILTGLLREKLNYKGLIITDSLEMAAISQFLSEHDAVIKAFKAGADITLMPFKIESPEDADAFIRWLDSLTLAISKDQHLRDKIQISYQAILNHKRKLGLHERVKQFVQDDYPSDNYDSSEDRLLAQQLSRASFTQIKPVLSSFNPMQTNARVGDSTNNMSAKQGIRQYATNNITILAIMPDKLRCEALIRHAEKEGLLDIACISALSQTIPKKIPRVDMLIVGDVTPVMSLYESKETEGISANERKDPNAQEQALTQLLQRLPASTKKILLKLRAPYVSTQEVAQFDAIFASYDYQVVNYPNGEIYASSFETFISVLLGKQQAQGKLPVSLNNKVNALLQAPASSHFHVSVEPQTETVSAQ